MIGINFFIRIERQVLFLILVIHRSRLIDRNKINKNNLEKVVSADKMIFKIWKYYYYES